MQETPRPDATDVRRHAGPRRSDDVHAAIIAAVLDLAGEGGAATASIEAVARRAGAGKQTVYRWWPDRSALFSEAYRSLVSAERLAGMPSEDAEADIEVMLGRLFRICGRSPAAALFSGLAAMTIEGQAAEATGPVLMFGGRDVVRERLRAASDSGDLAAEFDIDAACETAFALVAWRMIEAPGRLDGAFARDVARRAFAVGLAGV